MPKRAKTPPLDDGAKYLTVVGPYPAHPNMELDRHRREFAQWIAACTGPQYLRAFFHKPTSPGSVIVEIDESFPDFKRLLGAHRWSEFLVNPKDEARFVSKVFYCTYNSDRDVQKNGWKRVDVQDKWFNARAAAKFVSPYPATHWCEVPVEKNVIHNPLSRPLPRSDFPPPPPEPSPVVGTPEWQEWKKRQNAPRTITAWTRGSVPGMAAAATAPAAAAPPPASRTASSGSTRSTNGPQPIPRTAWQNATTPLTPPGLPIGIMRGDSSSGASQRSAAGESAWGDPPSQRSGSPPETPSSSGSDDVPPATPSDNGPPQDAMVAGNRVEGAFAELSLDDYEDDVYYSVNGGSVAGDDPPADNVPEFDVLLMPRADAVFVRSKENGNVRSAQDDNNPGDLDDDDDDDEEEEEDPKQRVKCPEHNVVCRKGICLVMAAILREQKREKRRQEFEREKAEALKKREKNAKKKKGNRVSSPDGSSPTASGTATPTSDFAPVRQPPPHLRVRAPITPAPAPPAHLKAGAPPPSPGSTRPMPPHLSRGASSNGPTSPPPPGERLADTRSEGSGWGNISEGPWGAAASGMKKARSTPQPGPASPAPKAAWGGWGKAPSISASSVQRNNASWSVSARSAAGGDDDDNQAAKANSAPAGKRAEGAWGKAPSISASSARRNHDSWSVSTRSVAGGNAGKGQQPAAQRPWGGWGKAPSISASSVRRNHDSWSVATRSAAGGDDDDAHSVAESDDAGWGRPPSVVGEPGPKRTWADEMDEEDEANAFGGPAADDDDDVRSVAGSTASQWGNVSAGPW